MTESGPLRWPPLVMACEVKAATSITLQCQCQANQCLMAHNDLHTDVGNLGGQLLYGWKTHLYVRKRRTAVGPPRETL